MALEAKNKTGFIDGSLTAPASDSADFAHWVRCNSMVRSWLMHSTISSISHSILWLDSAHDIWVNLHDRFSPKNAPRTFEMRCALSTHVQGTDSISAYYTILKGYRDELLSYHALPPCSCGALKTLHEFREPIILLGLNDSYAAVCSQILLMDPLPSVNKAYSILLQEERQRTLHDSRSTMLDQVTMAVSRPPFALTSRFGGSSSKPHYHCT
ncbi:uncharacterized protein LOC122067307 [Macadamia integrifolia]|uniref:uncharacterized protein LOC122067307 n=1 Tax=Macadamia integrifolia TaxID=60698 RepID=UPI001C4E9EA4|nr:uncharacterized protein LOC122067307 [Macadamia integrifolia]